MLSALAQHTRSVRLSALVTGNTYRNPALLAKTLTTLDHVSKGRATLGIGCGWFELEHQDLVEHGMRNIVLNASCPPANEGSSASAGRR